VDHRPYQGVRFTGDGRRAAVSAIRVHRIVERFLADMLGYAWNEADALAVAFEHDLPDEVIDRLYVALHRPETCPHGFPIPRAEADELPNTPELYDLEPGEVAEVAVSGSTDGEILTFLETLGVVPGVQVTVVRSSAPPGARVARSRRRQERRATPTRGGGSTARDRQKGVRPTPARRTASNKRRGKYDDGVATRRRRRLPGVHPAGG
jgi:Fe2+ transport system protein FeoA